MSGFHAWYAACAISAASKGISVHLEKSFAICRVYVLFRCFGVLLNSKNKLKIFIKKILKVLKISPIFSKFLEIGRYPLPLRVSWVPTVQKNRTLNTFASV